MIDIEDLNRPMSRLNRTALNAPLLAWYDVSRKR